MNPRASRIVCIPLLLVSSLLLTSCFEKVNNTLNTLCANITQGDYTKVYTDELATSYQRQFTASAFVNMAHQILGSNAQRCTVNAPEQNDATNSGAGIITVISPNGQKTVAFIRLVHEDGDWKISLITEER